MDITRLSNGHFTNIKGKKFNTTLAKKLTDSLSISESKLKSCLDKLRDWDFYFSLPLLKNQLTRNPRLRDKAEEIQEIITDLTRLFDLPLVDHTNLKYEMAYISDFFFRFSHGIYGNLHVLFEPRDYFIVQIYKNEYPVFYTLIKHRLSEYCKKMSIDFNERILTDFLYVFFSHWDNLTLSMYYKTSSSKLLLFSHLSQRHAENTANELTSLLSRSVDISLYDGQSISKEELAHYTFDILITTTSLSLDIKQPIHYLHRSNISLNLEHLNQEITKIKQLNKEKLYRTTLKEAKALADKLNKH